jgi:very-short-patch-repair endonuclease
MCREEEQREFARTLRNGPTDAEKTLWRHLRAEQLRHHKFRRQAAIVPYIVDFVCFARKLIIELDGPQHLEIDAAEHDTKRTAWLNSEGFRVLRFRNQQLDDDIRSVIETIAIALESPLPNPLPQGEGTNPERL